MFKLKNVHILATAHFISEAKGIYQIFVNFFFSGLFRLVAQDTCVKFTSPK